MHTDITFLKDSGRSELSIIGLDGEPSFINIVSDQTLKISKTAFTNKERQIVYLLMQGKLSKEISSIFKIEKLTVDTHRKNMLRKYGVTNTNELIGKAIKNGWI